MRNIFPSLSILLLFVTLTACKKEYTCACTFSYLVNGQTVTEEGTYIDEYNSKTRANEACQDWEDTYINSGATASSCVSTVN